MCSKGIEKVKCFSVVGSMKLNNDEFEALGSNIRTQAINDKMLAMTDIDEYDNASVAEAAGALEKGLQRQ